MKTTTNKTLSAKQVMDAARHVAAAGGDESRVYLYDVMVDLMDRQGVWMDGPEMRAELKRLAQAGQIRLSRCDLVSAFDSSKLVPEAEVMGCQFMAR